MRKVCSTPIRSAFGRATQVLVQDGTRCVPYKKCECKLGNKKKLCVLCESVVQILRLVDSRF